MHRPDGLAGSPHASMRYIRPEHERMVIWYVAGFFLVGVPVGAFTGSLLLLVLAGAFLGGLPAGVLSAHYTAGLFPFSEPHPMSRPGAADPNADTDDGNETETARGR